MSTPSTGHIPERSLIRKQSTRHLPQFEYLSASEASPSDHSSLYDASPLPTSSRKLQDAPWDSESEDDGKHVGTRLFTIIEQRSVPSLSSRSRMTPKGALANEAFPVREKQVCLQPLLSPELAQASHSRMAGRRCFSADDSVLVHRRGDFSNTPSEGISEPQNLKTPMLPVEPPYQPPKRMQTPTGVPRWPGEIENNSDRVQAESSTRGSLLQYLRRPASGSRLRDAFRGRRTPNIDRPTRTGARFWRPPTSGHGTRRFEGVESHPFSFDTVVKSAQEGVETCRQANDVLPRHSNPIEPAATQKSRDALRANLHEENNAVPVSQQRAAAQASTRTAAIPPYLRTPPFVKKDTGQTSHSPEMGTMRTADLIESFPSPPVQELCQQRSPPRKRSAWSLFPRSGPAPAHSDESEAYTLPVRGEAQTRYRQSGTPIYDPDAVSLRSLDLATQTLDGDTSTGREGTTLPLTETQRAISNGALRFSTRSNELTQNVEHQLTLPTESFEPEELCKHKLAKLCSIQKKHPYLVPTTNDSFPRLDGTCNPNTNPPPPIVAQDYALAGPSISTRGRQSIVQQMNRPPTTTTFVTAANGATTFTTSPTMANGPLGRSTTLASAHSASTMPGRA